MGNGIFGAKDSIALKAGKDWVMVNSGQLYYIVANMLFIHNSQIALKEFLRAKKLGANTIHNSRHPPITHYQ